MKDEEELGKSEPSSVKTRKKKVGEEIDSRGSFCRGSGSELSRGINQKRGLPSGVVHGRCGSTARDPQGGLSTERCPGSLLRDATPLDQQAGRPQPPAPFRKASFGPA